jgi:hypothetical protein
MTRAEAEAIVVAIERLIWLCGHVESSDAARTTAKESLIAAIVSASGSEEE